MCSAAYAPGGRTVAVMDFQSAVRPVGIAWVPAAASGGMTGSQLGCPGRLDVVVQGQGRSPTVAVGYSFVLTPTIPGCRNPSRGSSDGSTSEALTGYSGQGRLIERKNDGG